DTLHRGAGADEAGEERLELPLEQAGRRFRLTVARLAQVEALPQHRADRAEALAHRAAGRAVQEEHRGSRTRRCPADALDNPQLRIGGTPACDRTRLI